MICHGRTGVHSSCRGYGTDLTWRSMSTGPTPQPEESPSSDAERRALDDLRAALGDDFEIVRRLGRGSMATVYLAKEKALGRLVAVKVLLPGRARDETARRRFEREAKVLASLNHPGIVHR